MKLFSHIIIKFRILIICLSILITFILGYFIKDIRINPDIASYLPENDPVVSLFDYIGEEFGGNLMAMVVLEGEDIFNKRTIERINRLTQKFQTLEGVSYVMSLTNVLDIRKGEDGLEISRLIDEYDLPETPEEIEALRDYTLSKEIYRGHLVSEDSRAALIVCRLLSNVDGGKTAREIKGIVKELSIPEKVYFGGAPFMMLDVTSIILKDLIFLIPLVVLLCSLSLFLSFRTIHGVVLPLLSVTMSTLWTIGIMGLFDIPLTIISDIIPVILVAIGSAYSIHVLSKFNEKEKENKSSIQFSKKALSEVAVPVILAAVTTMVGFLSFVFGSYLKMIREFGFFASLGILFSLLISITFIPAILSLLPSPRKARKNNNGYGPILPFISQWVLKKKRTILIICMGLFIISLVGFPFIHRKSDIIDYFKRGTYTRRTEEILKTKFGGSVPIYIHFTGDIQDPYVLKEMKKMSVFLQSQGDIKNIQSVVTLLEEMSDIIGEEKTIPDTKGKVTNLWFLLEGEEIMNQLVNSDKTEGIIQATLQGGLDSERIKRFVRDITSYIDEQTETSHCTVRQTGMPSIYHNLDTSIIKSQIQSLIIAIILVFIILSLLFRSFIGGLKGIVPICFTLALIFGFMGFTKIPLDIATVLVGSISIGIGIDYSIHFVNRFKNEVKESTCPESLLKTISTTGKAIVTNVLTVGIGFLVLVLANLVPLQRFGLLVTITMFTSGFASILLLPVVLSFNKKKKERRIVSKKTTENTEKTTSLCSQKK